MPNHDVTSAVKHYLGLVAKLDRLIAEGASEAEQDALRDEMDRPWWSLTEQERRTVEVMLHDA